MDAELRKSKALLQDKAWTRSAELGAAVAGALSRLVIGTACLVGYMKINEFYPISRISDEIFIAENDWTYRMFYTFMV
jgi:hypothetical protein